jgi:hypothetical protein
LLLRVRPVRAAVDPAPPRQLVGAAAPSRPAAGDLPAHPRLRYFHGCYALGDDQLWGHHPAPQGRRPHPGGIQVDPRRSARRGADLRDLGQPVGQQDPRPSAAGQRATGSSCVSPRPAPPGPTRSRPSSARCAASCSAAPTIPTTRYWPASCKRTYAGATPTPATPRCWPPNAVSARVCSERQRRWGRPVRPAA